MQKETIILSRKSNGTSHIPIHPDPILAAEKISLTGVWRFFKNVEKSNGCWLWKGCSGHSGGVIGRGGAGAGNISTRALSWLIHIGTLPAGNVMLTCGNSLCTRPEHLGFSHDGIDPEIDWNRANRLRDMHLPDHGYVGQDPTLPKGFSTTFRDRFFAKVNKTPTCWLWTGYLNDDGYGHIGKGWNQRGQSVGAHIASWLIHHGPVPKGKCVLHNCPGKDCRSCVNPNHLWLGTNRENIMDAVAKSRKRGRGHWNATKLTIEQVNMIRLLHASGEISIGALGRQFSVDRAHISHIIHGLAWRGAEPLVGPAPEYCI